MSRTKPAPRSVEAIIEHFSEPLAAQCPLKPGMQLGVSTVEVESTSLGEDVVIAVTVLLPDGSTMKLLVEGHPWCEIDAETPGETVERLVEWTGLSDAAVRRRLRRAGFHFDATGEVGHQ